MKQTAAVLLLALAVTPAAAQEQEGHEMDHAAHAVEAPESGLRAELIADIDQLEQKYLGLARAMTDHWEWRPMEGVRSVGEVFGHVANANFMFPTMAGLEREMEGRNFETESAEAVLDGLAHSFTHARHSIAQVPDEALEEGVVMFGRDATKRVVLTTMVTHMHEHLGQAIAYARSNGVTPPWSGGG